MAGKLNLLSARAVQTIVAPGRHADGGNLYLNVSATGARSWVFFYRHGGRRKEMGLGPVRDVSLAKARELATAHRQTLAAGGDPMASREPTTVPAFGAMADQYVEDMRPSWRNAKHVAQWTMTLRDYAKPLRSKRVDEISTEDVLSALKPIWSTKPETASRVRGRIEAVLNAATAKGFRHGENPARWRGHLANLLPKRQMLSRGHHAALPRKDLPAFIDALRIQTGSSARALEFTILTAARSGEVLGARWAEIDLEAKVWTVPASRMKGGREHRVPLSDRVAGLLQQMAELRQGDFVFPGAKPGAPLSVMALDMTMRRMKAKATPHGFRSTFRDWAAEETSFPHEVCEMALAHAIGSKVEAAYRRGDLFEKRRKLMEAWASFCEPVGDKTVLPMRSRAR